MLALLSVLGPAARAESLTLNQALAAAYETNTQLQAQRAALRATDEDVATAVSGWRPTVTANANYGYTRDRTTPPEFNVIAPNGHPRDAGVTLTQPIINGATIPQTQQAKAGVEAGRAQLSSVEQSTLLNAAKAYFDVLADEAQLNYKRHNVARLTDQVQMTQERVAIRDLARSDLDIVQARLSAAGADVATAEGNLAAARAAFLRTVGRPAETLEQAPRTPAPARDRERRDGGDTHQQSRPDGDEIPRQTGGCRRDRRLWRFGAERLAAIAVQGIRRRAGPGHSRHFALGDGPTTRAVYQSGSEYAQIRRAAELRSKAILQAADQERIVRQTLDASWQTLVAARTAANLNRQQVQAAQSAYDGIVIGLRAGERTTFDVLNAEQDLEFGASLVVEAERQYNETTFQLLAGPAASRPAA